MGSIATRTLSGIKKVAVIGGGPSGAVAAKSLLGEGLSPVIFERRPNFGGVWNYTPETKTKLDKVPLTDPNVEDGPVPSADGRRPVFMSPIYDALETNIPKDLMIFNKTYFDKELQLFPKHEDVNGYVQNFSKDLIPVTKFDSLVEGIKRGLNGKWEVQSRNMASDRVEEAYFDAVVIATGHYNVPFIPPIQGMEQFEERYPGSIEHSKYFRVENAYTGKKVIVVGNSASGTDIAMHLVSVAKLPVLQSIRSPSKFPILPGPGQLQMKPQIVDFSIKDRTVVFEDGSTESDVDVILFCTGYLHSFPYLQETDKLEDKMVTDGFFVHRLFQHVFFIPDPTLSLVGLPTKVIPFPFTECQAGVIAGVYSGRLKLPSETEMRKWEQDLLEKRGGDRHFHFLNFPDDANYMDMLNDWNAKGGDNGGKLYAPTHWGERERAIRAAIPKIKVAFMVAKEEGRIAKTMEELGFHFE